MMDKIFNYKCFRLRFIDELSLIVSFLSDYYAEKYGALIFNHLS